MGSYALPGYSLEEAIRLIADTGFDSVEIAAMPGYHGAPDQLTKEQRTRARQQIADSGLQFGALMGLPIPDANREAENVEWMKQLIQLARDLSPDGSPLIQGVLGGGDWEQQKTLYRDTLGAWLELAGQAGVRLAIKPHRFQAMDLPQQAIGLIKQLNARDSLGLVFDYSHYAFRGLNQQELIRMALPYTSYIVLKDAVPIQDKVQFELPGETTLIPHADILRQFIEGGYQGDICAEVSSHLSKAADYHPAEATRTCHRHLRRIMEQAQETGFESIFNGQDLSEWDGKPGCWDVRNGEIWCTGEAKDKNWLIWRGAEPGDFTLRLEFLWKKGNSGVQIRSDDLGRWQVFGYQVEVAEQPKMGLWHHSLLDKDHPKKEARHFMSTAGDVSVINPAGVRQTESVADAAALQATYQEQAWNSMEIIASGPTLIQKINGTVFATLTDHDREMSRLKGWIALQDHGKGCQVAYRNLRIKLEN